MMIQSADDILFRCSSLHKLMTEPQGKTNAQKYKEAIQSLELNRAEYMDIVNKQTKTAIKKMEKIAALENDSELNKLKANTKKIGRAHV